MSIKIEHIRESVLEHGHIRGCFVIHNLLPGQAQTIGNALQQVLVTNVSGTAITGIKILNVSYEFVIIPGIREDIREIILNLKKIIIKTDKKEPFFGKIILNDSGIITGKSITFDSNTFIINPNQYIATIETKTKTEFEIILKQNSNYQIINQFENKDSNFYKIDATFMPIVNVSYEVLDVVHSGFNEKCESLTLEIITNGSITPKYALQEALLELKTWFDMINLMTISKQ